MKYQLKPILMAFAILGATVSSSSADILGYWPFEDDQSGTTVADVSGNGNDGVGSDSFTFSSEGKIGSAGDFGDYNNQAFVAIAAAADGAFDSIVEKQTATIAFWMNRQAKDSASQWTFIFDGGASSSDPVGGRQLASHAGWGGGNGTLYFDTGGCCGGTQRINKEMVLDNGDLPAIDGLWHHLAYVRDVDTTFVYIDGELFHSSEEGAITSPIAPMIQATLGADAAGTNSQAGLLDDFAIWDEALSVERIQSLAAGAPAVGENGPDFNEDGVVDIADFNILVENFGGAFAFGESGAKGDHNGDLRVNLNDFLAFRADFNAPAGALASVPEPSGLALLGFAGLTLGFLRRRRS